ncbi:MAG: serine protease [Candidatus Paceibacterota bacterium]
MPFLIRIIAQRVFLVIVSSLTVLGLSPHADIDDSSNLNPIEEIIEEESPGLIQELTQIPLPKINILNLPDANITKPKSIQTPLPIIPPEPIKTPVIKITEKIITPISTVPAQTIPQAQQSPEIVSEQITVTTAATPDTSAINSIENVLVNILCIRQIGNMISLSTGSGVIISSSGVVLTNAHVAQQFLLKDAGYNCTLRRENIPLYGFNAVPLYISETWIEENYRQINNSSPTGTGKYDYALLLITGNTNPTLALPAFPSLKINTDSNFLDVGDTVTIAGYPGKMTSSLEIAKNTELQTDRVRIREIFTLGQNTVDVVATGDTTVAQRGSSGGGAFKDNVLGGIIVSTNTGSSAEYLVANVLTLSYINREIKNETGRSLSSFITGNLQTQAEDFELVAPRLEELLMRNL